MCRAVFHIFNQRIYMTVDLVTRSNDICIFLQLHKCFRYVQMFSLLHRMCSLRSLEHSIYCQHMLYLVLGYLVLIFTIYIQYLSAFESQKYIFFILFYTIMIFELFFFFNILKFERMSSTFYILWIESIPILNLKQPNALMVFYWPTIKKHDLIESFLHNWPCFDAIIHALCNY